MRRAALLVLLLLLFGGSALAEPRPGYGWPLRGTPAVERAFDPPRSAWGAGHRGVDLRAAAGQRVLAAGAGRVSYAGLLAGRGVITVQHAGGLRTTYEPVTPSVRVGVWVSLGAVLGQVADGHESCRRASCLHWGLRRGKAYLDPLALVRGGPVRLLPLGAPPRAQGLALSGRLAVRPLPRPPAEASPVGTATGRAPAAAVVALGGVMLGWTAWRRQDARGRALFRGS